MSWHDCRQTDCQPTTRMGSENGYVRQTVGKRHCFQGQQIYNVMSGYLSRFPIQSNQCEKAAKAIYDIFHFNGLAPQYLRVANALDLNLFIFRRDIQLISIMR